MCEAAFQLNQIVNLYHVFPKTISCSEVRHTFKAHLHHFNSYEFPSKSAGNQFTTQRPKIPSMRNKLQIPRSFGGKHVL